MERSAPVEPDVALGIGGDLLGHGGQRRHAHQLLTLQQVLDVDVAAVGLRGVISGLGLVGHQIGKDRVAVDLLTAVGQVGQIRPGEKFQGLVQIGMKSQVSLCVVDGIINHSLCAPSVRFFHHTCFAVPWQE